MKLVKPFNKDDLFQPKEPVVGPTAGGKTLNMVAHASKFLEQFPNATIHSNFVINASDLSEEE